jgi:hypothetical protein
MRHSLFTEIFPPKLFMYIVLFLFLLHFDLLSLRIVVILFRLIALPSIRFAYCFVTRKESNIFPSDLFIVLI